MHEIREVVRQRRLEVQRRSADGMPQRQRVRVQEHASQPGRMLVATSTSSVVREALQKMGYTLQFSERTSGPITAIWFDRKHGTMWGAASNHGEDYGVVW